MEHSPTDFVRAYNDTENYPLIADVCRALEMSERSVRRYATKFRLEGLEIIKRGSRESETGALGFAPVLPGYAIKQTSTQFDGETGAVEREWIKTTKAPGDEFEPPEDHEIAGISALVDGEGRTMMKWVKTKRDKVAEDRFAALTGALASYKPIRLIKQPKHTRPSLVTVYNIADHHLGMWAWHRRTGTAYNNEIARKLLLDTTNELIASTPKAKTCVLLNLGDYFHSDNTRNQTEKSGNALDVDGEYAQVIQLGVELFIALVELALQKHDKVIVRCLPGNHDEKSALWLAAAVGAAFARNPRVEVDLDPGKFWHWQFGKVMLSATHGDMVKPDEMAGVMASNEPRMWGETLYRYAYFGHVHHKSKGGGEKHGVTWETFQSLAGKDGYHHSHGYSSGRSMTAVTHHQEKGEIGRVTVNVR